MSFDIVAASRVETEDARPWKHAFQVGAQLGLAGFMLALVGILGMFNNRPIIVGVLTLGYATLGLVYASIGIVAARRHLFASAGQTVLAGAAAGLLAAAIVAILPLAMSLINLRTIFVALDPRSSNTSPSPVRPCSRASPSCCCWAPGWAPPARSSSSCPAGCAGR
jgi:hypothetical protein